MTKGERTKKLKAPHLPSAISDLRKRGQRSEKLGSEVEKKFVNVNVKVNVNGGWDFEGSVGPRPGRGRWKSSDLYH